jgi:hypothetical protein
MELLDQYQRFEIALKLTKGRNMKAKEGIPPISRNSMMRVDRNDIWGNLTQIIWGVSYRLSRVIRETYRSPSLLFSLFDDTDMEEKERSRYNKQQLESIRNVVIKRSRNRP